MFEFKLPNAFWIFKRYGLLVTDDEVVFFSCARGRFEQLGVFSNDAEGVSRFEQEIKANEKKYRGKTFHIVVNVIGEDYRFERVAHLIGKYRNDFHARRCKQFFRGSNLYMSEVHGREELGRREDLVLFYGVLTSQKVEPWVKALQTVDAQIAGAHPVFACEQADIRGAGHQRSVGAGDHFSRERHGAPDLFHRRAAALFALFARSGQRRQVH